MGEMIELACSVCGAGVFVSTANETQLRRTHRAFYCPNGHAQSFKPTPAPKADLDDLREELKDSQEDRNYWREAWEREQMKAAEERKLARTCPLCDEVMPRHRSRLANHLVFEHGADARTTAQREAEV